MRQLTVQLTSVKRNCGLPRGSEFSLSNANTRPVKIIGGLWGKGYF